MRYSITAIVAVVAVVTMMVAATTVAPALASVATLPSNVQDNALHATTEPVLAEVTARMTKLPKASFYDGLDPTDALLTAVATRLSEFHKLPAAKSATAYQARFAGLEKVERAIYAWYTDLASKTRLLNSEFEPLVARLLAACEKERETLVEGARAHATVLPMDVTRLTDTRKAELLTLWASLLTSSGKVKVLGEPEYRRHIFAALSYMIGTPLGARQLELLNKAPNGEVADSPDAALTCVYIAQEKDDLPAAVIAASPDLEMRAESKAYPIGTDEKNPQKTLEEIVYAKLEDIASPDGLDRTKFLPVTKDTIDLVRTAVFDGADGYFAPIKGNKYKKVTFRRATGRGSLMVLVPGIGTSGDTNGNRILTPTWMTVVHELGHSVSIRTGSAMAAEKTFLDDLVGVKQSMDRWTDTEEFLTIVNIENKVREEVGLTKRFGHAMASWATDNAVEVRKRLQAPLLRVSDHYDDSFDDPEFEEVLGVTRRLKAAQCLDDRVIAASEARRDAWIQQKVDTELPLELRRILKDDQAKADAILAAPSLANNPAMRVEVLVFLKVNADRVPRIRKLLRTTVAKLITDKKSKRNADRASTLIDLALGTIAL